MPVLSPLNHISSLCSTQRPSASAPPAWAGAAPTCSCAVTSGSSVGASAGAQEPGP